MRISQQEKLYQLSFMPNLFPVNCYFVEEEASLTLIDAALPYSAKAILKTAYQIGKPIKRIVITHAHGDHVGALDELKQTLKDVPVFISERDARLLEGDRSLDSHEPNTPIRGGVPKKLKTRADVLLKDGDEIESLLAVSTPGHTPGSMSFFDVRTKAMIAGDAFQTRGGIAVSGQLRPMFPFPAMATWNQEVALDSARKIKEMNPSLLAVGHGNLVLNPVSYIEKAILEAEKNL